MPRRAADDDDWDDEEEPDEDDSDADESETIACPYCHRQIDENSQHCPYCERYISTEDAPRPRKSWLIIVGTLLGLYAVYRWIIG